MGLAGVPRRAADDDDAAGDSSTGNPSLGAALNLGGRLRLLLRGMTGTFALPDDSGNHFMEAVSVGELLRVRGRALKGHGHSPHGHDPHGHHRTLTPFPPQAAACKDTRSRALAPRTCDCAAVRMPCVQPAECSSARDRAA